MNKMLNSVLLVLSFIPTSVMSSQNNLEKKIEGVMGIPTDESSWSSPIGILKKDPVATIALLVWMVVVIYAISRLMAASAEEVHDIDLDEHRE